MTKNKVSYSRLIDTIEGGIEQVINLSVVCDYKLAQALVEFIDIEYPEFTDNCELDERVDEYYITFENFDDELTITCEFARGKHGLFKHCDIQPCGYLVFLANWREVLHAIDSEVIALCELVEDENEFEEACADEYEAEWIEGEDCCFECDCGIIDYNVERILEASPCPHCVREVLIGLVDTIKRKYGIEAE